MDRDRFDALTRVLAASGSRRGTIAALLGGAVLGAGAQVAAKNNDDKKKKKHKGARRCFGNKSCDFPADGKDFEACDFAGDDIAKCSGCNFRRADLGSADFEGGKFQGSSFREANLRGADFAEADVSGASFRDACLVDADFTGADISGASFRGAILCATLLPDGSVDDSGCDKTDHCCPSCLLLGAACGSGIAGACCGGTICISGTCTFECLKDTDCPTGEFCCENQCGVECCEGSQCPQGLCSQGQCVECITSDNCEEGQTCCADGTCNQCCNDFSGQCASEEFCCDGSCQQCCDNTNCPFDLECVDGVCVEFSS